jgi:hypothetical protein
MTAVDPAPITAHGFYPRFEWWGLCCVCGFGMAAHETVVPQTAGQLAEEMGLLPFRCPECVSLSDLKPQQRDRPCPHQREI